MNIIKVKLDSFVKIQNLFSLLSLPGNDLELEKEYTQLLLIVSQKEEFLSLKNYDMAANSRTNELDSIKKILDLLSKKGFLDKNILQIQIEEKLI